MTKKELKEKAPKRSRHIDFRVNDEEFDKDRAIAESCGLEVSDYCRKLYTGHEPKYHLTDHEIEAYKSLTDARGDLVHIRSALKGKTQEQIRAYFNDDDFMRLWISAVNRIIKQWDDILEQLRN